MLKNLYREKSKEQIIDELISFKESIGACNKCEYVQCVHDAQQFLFCSQTNLVVDDDFYCADFKRKENG